MYFRGYPRSHQVSAGNVSHTPTRPRPISLLPIYYLLTILSVDGIIQPDELLDPHFTNQHGQRSTSFLKPEDLENVRVSSLLSLVANTGLGLVSLTSWTGEEIQCSSNNLGVVRVRQGTPHSYLLLLLLLLLLPPSPTPRAHVNYILQGASNMTGTNCDMFTHKSSRSYLNHLVLLQFARAALWPPLLFYYLSYRRRC